MRYLNKEEFEKVVADFKDGIQKKKLSNYDHFNGEQLSSGPAFLDQDITSQYIGLINPGMHLGTVVNKLDGMERVDDPIDNSEIYPSDISDELIRFCELKRENPVYIYKDKDTNVVFGAVSDQHLYVPDKDIFDVCENFLQDIPHESTYAHNMKRFVMNHRFPELAVELGSDNALNFRITVGGSSFGFGSCFVRSGSYEQWCTNGAMAWSSDFQWTHQHRWSSAENLLRDYTTAIRGQLAEADRLLPLLEEANEINERIIEAQKDVVKVLRSDRFNLLKREAEGVYKKMRSKDQYTRYNGFDIGRAIAEVARDTGSFDRSLELEQKAQEVMLCQV